MTARPHVRRPVARTAALVTVVALAVTGTVLTAPTSAPAGAKPPAPTPRPNVVVIVSDDQPKGLMDAMPNVVRLIRDRGVALQEGYIPTSLCCPSRASLLTGKYAHTTGVYTVRSGDNGGWPAFQSAEQTTLATQLDAAGYQTGLFGKYLNGFVRGAPDGYVPPGWDEFVAFHGRGGGDAAYYNYTLEGTTTPVAYGTSAEDYSTDVIAGRAAQFVAQTPTSQPLFLYFAPYGAHAPYKPAPRHRGTWPREPASAIPALNEADVSDKPAWIRDNELVSASEQRSILTRQHETIRSVDDAVGTIVDALGDRLDNTLIVYLSDNGFMLGAHRIIGKNVPHRASTEVPMFMRWDGVLPAGTTSSRVTTNIDLTATIAEATGTSWPMAGLSFLSQNRTGTLLEQLASHQHPAYCGWRTTNYLYVEYSNNEGRELYDYSTDPNELDNVVRDQRYAQVVERLRAKAKAACSPVPPGFSWTA